MHLSLSANNNNKYKEEHDTHHMLILGINEDKWNFKECTLSSLFFDSVTEAFDLDSPIKNATESTYIVGSCNGLIFLVRSSKSSILWNPTIRKYSYLPGFRRRWEKTYARYGFGYDEIHDDYKVVGIFHAGSDSGGDSDDVEKWETIEKPSYGEGEWDSSRWEVIFVSLVILRELIYVDGL
ncbi:F-box/kelch-repeat protein like [Capsicum galapagoense]